MTTWTLPYLHPHLSFAIPFYLTTSKICIEPSHLSTTVTISLHCRHVNDSPNSICLIVLPPICDSCFSIPKSWPADNTALEQILVCAYKRGSSKEYVREVNTFVTSIHHSSFVPTYHHISQSFLIYSSTSQTQHDSHYQTLNSIPASYLDLHSYTTLSHPITASRIYRSLSNNSHPSTPSCLPKISTIKHSTRHSHRTSPFLNQRPPFSYLPPVSHNAKEPSFP